MARFSVRYVNYEGEISRTYVESDDRDSAGHQAVLDVDDDGDGIYQIIEIEQVGEE